MITQIEFPTQLKPFYELYQENFNLSEERFDEALRKAVVNDDHVLIADKNKEKIYGFILAKVSVLQSFCLDEECVEVLAAYTKDSDTGIWGSLVKSLLRWAEEKGIHAVYLLRNLRRRKNL